MAQKSEIEWTDATWNPVTGCTKIGPGCDHCYAEWFAERWRGILHTIHVVVAHRQQMDDAGASFTSSGRTRQDARRPLGYAKQLQACWARKLIFVGL
ncbi:DUF5131 family protein [Sedimentitalea sp. HM32M-2]|uniref:DUF5131 family protein n=1 Tax=Sedimentitalea sp. HM32M-2 TaxID=3351566 RepID=UPI0036256B7E